MKAQVYKDPRPAEYFDRFHERRAAQRPDWVYELGAAACSRRTCCSSTARAASTRDNVPAEGPVIIAPNHFSFLDHFFVAVFLRRKVQLHGEVAALQAAAAVHLHARRRVPGAPRPPRRGGVQDRARDPRPRRHRSSCTPRAAARARGELGEPRRHRPAGARVGRAGRARRRSRAPSTRATGSGSSSRRSRSSSASRSASSRWPSPTKEQAQAASEIVFARVREMHTLLVGEGRKEAAPRGARGAAHRGGRRRAAAPRPATSRAASPRPALGASIVLDLPATVRVGPHASVTASTIDVAAASPACPDNLRACAPRSVHRRRRAAALLVLAAIAAAASCSSAAATVATTAAYSPVDLKNDPWAYDPSRQARLRVARRGRPQPRRVREEPGRDRGHGGAGGSLPRTTWRRRPTRPASTRT